VADSVDDAGRQNGITICTADDRRDQAEQNQLAGHGPNTAKRE
jgi:hypothetical protein